AHGRQSVGRLARAVLFTSLGGRGMPSGFLLAWGLIGLGAAGSGRVFEDWPAWRGPRGDGSSFEKNLPLRWSATENVHWKTKIPGIGHSSPVIHGDRVFLTTCLLKEQQRVLLCLDRRDGKILWQRVVFTAPLEAKHGLNSYASATPA